jgi:hypothetical protein
MKNRLSSHTESAIVKKKKKKIREREIQRGAWWGAGGVCQLREHAFLFQVLLK